MTASTTAKTRTRRAAKDVGENNTPLSAALTRAEQAETALKDANAQIAALNERLALARKSFAELRDAAREAVAEARAETAVLRASRPAQRPQTDAQRAYAQRAAEGRTQHAVAVTATRERVAAFWEAHKDAGIKSATMAQINEWFEQPAPVDCE